MASLVNVAARAERELALLFEAINAEHSDTPLKWYKGLNKNLATDARAGCKTGAWLRSVLNGYYQYHAVPGNLRALKRFGHPRGAGAAAGVATPHRQA